MRHDQGAALPVPPAGFQTPVLKSRALVHESRALITRARGRSRDQHRYALEARERGQEQSDRTLNSWARALGLTCAGEGRTGDDVLDLVLDSGRALVDGCGSISLTTVDQLGGDADRCLTAASTGRAEAIDSMQFRLGEGPCIDAVELDMICVVRADDLAATSAAPCWPRFSEAAAALGVRSSLSIALPWSALRVGLQTERRALGAINFYADEAHAFGRGDAHAEMLGAWVGSILSGQEPAALYRGGL